MNFSAPARTVFPGLTPNRRRILPLACLAVILTLAGARSGEAAPWGPWEDLGEGVHVRCTQVNRDTWTWSFRNVGTTTITFMEFTYTDRDGEHRDVLPGSLQPGRAIGGWAAFTASSRPTFRIVELRRR